jgi:hypothetical protein
VKAWLQTAAATPQVGELLAGSPHVMRSLAVSYEVAVKADGFLVMAHGTAAEMARAKAILGTANPSRLDLHQSIKTAEPAEALVPAG